MTEQPPDGTTCGYGKPLPAGHSTSSRPVAQTTPSNVPHLVIDDHTIAKIAAYRAANTPGVARLQPHLGRAVAAAATRRVTSTAAQLIRTARRDNAPVTTGHAATQDVATDTGAIDVDHNTATSTLRISVRIVASGHRSVYDTITALHEGLVADLRRLTDLSPEVRVYVLDLHT